jgi:hypothetical protein
MTHENQNARQPRKRDVRLDFFRGLGMFIILIAHITNNPWTLYIPARFGFSDATEMFIFCSGMASAIAFGSVFARAGFLLGCFRVIHRIWQVYWVHIGAFFFTLVAMLMINKSGYFPRDEVGALNLYPFLKSSGANVIGLFTLTYVPNYFDILPMYVVILALLPLMFALARVHPMVALAASFAIWIAANFYQLNLPAELWFSNNSTRQWYFNPFAWQLVFFTGFAFMSGWIAAPPVRKEIVILAAAVVIISLPFAWHVIIAKSEFVREWRNEWKVLFDKTNFGFLRYVHFLALAYLAWVAVGPAGERLEINGFMGGLTRMFQKVGQQSLAVFATSVVLARVLGAILFYFNGTPLAALGVNILGFVLIYSMAVFMGFAKGEPWKRTSKPLDNLVASKNTVERPKLVVVN